ncbi:MAG: endolytic transglycosylase MltG [Candidatus Acidiferrales bacterium]
MRGFTIFVIIVLLIAGGAIAWLEHDWRAPYKGFEGDKIFVDIPHGLSRRAISRLLEKNGVVYSHMSFELLTRLHERQPLQAGEYLFDAAISPRDVLEKIANGRVYVHSVTIPEGWTMFDIADELERQGLCRRQDFLAAARDPAIIRDMAPDARSLDGFLFPATYDFAKHTTPQQLAAEMVQRFRTVWASLPGIGHDANGEATGLPAGMSLEQVVTMASLVERETPSLDEKPIVAGVFYNRLARRLPLQCDPTVIYALDLAGRPTHILQANEVHFDSPYNTYIHQGLPPGPIANPGESSLRAAISPANVPFLYFVANTQGGHFFSKSLEEHNHNVARYRQLLKELVTPSQPQASAPNPHSSAPPPTKQRIQRHQ